MPDGTSDSWGAGLVYQGHLPLVWTEVPTHPGEARLADLDQANVEVLRTILSLESHPVEMPDDPAETSGPELMRLDFKVNVLLDLVGQLLARQGMIPEPRPLALTSKGAHWQDAAAPARNALLRIELYCSVKYPRPLVLHGRVREVHSRQQGWAVGIEFEGLGELAREGLERLIFIHHRRTIAHHRRRDKRNSF